MQNGNVPERVMALYGQPGFETWASVGKALRLSRGSAWSLAHGLRQPTTRDLNYLECAEFRLDGLEQATANLCRLLGRRKVLPTVFGRGNHGQ